MHKENDDLVAPWLGSRRQFTTLMVKPYYIFLCSFYYIYLWLVLHLWFFVTFMGDTSAFPTGLFTAIHLQECFSLLISKSSFETCWHILEIIYSSRNTFSEKNWNVQLQLHALFTRGTLWTKIDLLSSFSSRGAFQLYIETEWIRNVYNTLPRGAFKAETFDIPSTRRISSAFKAMAHF